MLSTLLDIAEIMIFVLGSGAVFLLNLNNRWSRWGAVLGLISEPFWFLSAYASGSWGVFAVSFIYTISYVVGIYNFWFRKAKTNKKFKR